MLLEVMVEKSKRRVVKVSRGRTEDAETKCHSARQAPHARRSLELHSSLFPSHHPAILATMPRVPYCYPKPGSSTIADAIRVRRGERGLTPLDGMLLNAAPIAEGWNKLLGAVRTGSTLRDDLREIMVRQVGTASQENLNSFTASCALADPSRRCPQQRRL